jgi:hypothetical protein
VVCVLWCLVCVLWSEQWTLCIRRVHTACPVVCLNYQAPAKSTDCNAAGTNQFLCIVREQKDRHVARYTNYHAATTGVTPVVLGGR